ncbi:hypothetical protein ANAPC5_01501 [Anaplasma phagocytophilum]|nr:hypothetical protein ANAPC5_01501 [Anaplasma phagocytophilum]
MKSLSLRSKNTYRFSFFQGRPLRNRNYFLLAFLVDQLIHISPVKIEAMGIVETVFCDRKGDIAREYGSDLLGDILTVNLHLS